MNSSVEDTRKLTEEIISSCESRISAVCAIVDNTHRLLDDFKGKRNAMIAQLRKTLAREKSFREKEFESLMKDVLGFQDAIENETRVLLNMYLDEQKKADKTIRKALEKRRVVCIKEGTDGIIDFRKKITDIQVNLRASEELHDMELHDMLTAICRKHKMTVEFMQSFLVKGTETRTQDLKITVKNKCTRSEGWWKVFKQMVFQWRELNSVMSDKMAEERNNIYMATSAAATRLSIANINFNF